MDIKTCRKGYSAGQDNRALVGAGDKALLNVLGLCSDSEQCVERQKKRMMIGLNFELLRCRIVYRAGAIKII